MASDRERKAQEREKLKGIITQWNANRLDIFWLSDPNEELEFHGAMRFYFQDAGQKVATKCIRVSSTATTSDVIETLIEKFRPDIRMLSIPEYALYEIHENGEERKLGDEEKPLFVQLDWHKDDREGRFLLRRMDEKSYISSMDAYDNDHFKRKLSKREKKEKKKREKKEKLKAAEESKKDGIAEQLYSELPETSFTRSISNPEAVMRRRRQQKLEKKLQQFRQEGGTDAGGTLRIFGESLNKDVPYKTLLLSMKDTAAYVVKEILEKYGYDKEDPSQYCLVQVIIPQASGDGVHDFQSGGGIREYILDDDDCPLTIEHQHNRGRGILTFHVRRRPADYQPRKRKKKPKPTKGETDSSYRYEDSLEKLPYLLELNPDGSDLHGTPKKHRLYLNVTEVGCERSSSTGGQYLQLFGPNVQPRHCVIAHTEGIVTVTPSSREAETHVNNIRIYETTILQPGMIVRFGKLHAFRFVDPMQDMKRGMSPDPRQAADFLERNSRREDQLSLHHHGSYETTFDAEGNVETVSTHSRDDRMSKKSDDAHSHRSLGRESSQGRGSYDKFEQRRGNDPILPAVLEFWEEGEDAFLTSAITQLDPSQVQFKLSPTYTLYMSARYRASTHFRPETTPSDRAHRLTALMNKVAAVIHQVIQDRYRDASALAFWLANASELLHFLKQDRHLSAYTLDAQDLLAESVQLAFRSLVTCQQGELQAAMPVFLEDRDDVSEEEGTTADVLAVLSGAMSLLRRCRVNAALTIQMFSQLFHYINMWLFNKVVCDNRPNLCTRLWGVRLKRRLGRVEAWAEKQGLELAADCHLSRIVQAAHLLQAPKSNSDDLAAISSLCYKLNSLQLQTLLERYQPVPDEPRIPRELIDSVVKVAENTADEQARSEGREVKLEEDTDLQLPFLLPEDGYSCDIVRGVPAGLQEFLQPLIQSGFCRLTIQPTSSGYWTIYMSDQDIGRLPSGGRSPSVHSHVGDGEGSGWGQPMPTEPEVATIRLQKSNNGIGLSIVAAGGIDQDKLGIYVKSVVKGGAADLDGRLQAGDQLLKVDGQSLVGVNQEKAAELMTRTGPVVTLEVAKQGAIYHGLAALLSKPSPIIQRVITNQQRQRAFGLPPSGCENDEELEHEKAIEKWHSSSILQLQQFSPSLVSLEIKNGTNCNVSAASVPRQWETIQTLDRSNKNKKSISVEQHRPFSYLKGSLQGPLLPTQHNMSKIIQAHNTSKPKSDESLLEHNLACSCVLCCPSCRWEIIYNRPRSDESISSHPKDCLCVDCCPICLWLKGQRIRNESDGQSFENSYCTICERFSQNSSHSVIGPPNSTPPNTSCASEEPALACCSCYYCHHDSSIYLQNSTLSTWSLSTSKQKSEKCNNTKNNLDQNTEKSKSEPSCNSDVLAKLVYGRFSPMSLSNPAKSWKMHHNSLERLVEGEKSPVAGSDSSQANYYSTVSPRRMSERDIPSRLMNEQGQELRLPTGPGHVMPPRMQSSKSVPSLNSNGGHSQEPVRVPSSNGNLRAHEVYNPAYSRTSSTTSIPKATEFSDNGTRSKSTNNLRQEPPPASESRYPYGHTSGQNPPPYPGPPGSLNGRPVSQPNLLQQPSAQQEERHYQNISMYQQQPPQQQNAYPHSRSPSQPYPSQPTRPLHGSQSSLNRPEQQVVQSPNDRSRPMSTLVSTREQEQYVSSLGYAHSPGSGPPPSPKGSQGPRDPHHLPQGYGQKLVDQRDFRSAEHLRYPEGEMRPTHPEALVYSDQVPRGYSSAQQEYSQQHHVDPRQRDLMRQEAKMEEMREEVRRREERECMMQHQMGRGSSPWGHPRGPHPNIRQPSNYIQGPYNTQQPVSSQAVYGMSGPPAPAPKPRPQFAHNNPTSERLQRPPGYEINNVEGSPLYQDSPPPPPLPTTSHPLQVQHSPRFANPPPPVVSYRYGPSGYPPRAGDNMDQKFNQLISQPVQVDPRVSAPHNKPPIVQSSHCSRVTFELPQLPSGQDKKEASNLTSPSPWEREEKEKLHKQRLEEARRVRDEEIMELENLPYRTPKQEERLRTLRLEQEFQRRAEELHGEEEEDDDDDLLDRAENRERMLKMQEDLERARQRRLEWEQEHMPQQNPLQKQQILSPQEEWKRQHHQLEEQEGRLRQLRLEEVNRKRELEAAKDAEERLLREARRRQDEEYKGQHSFQPPLPNRPNQLVISQQTNNPPQIAPSFQQRQNAGNLNQHDIPPPLPTSPPPVEPNFPPVYSQNNTQGLQPPPPHLSGSSVRNQRPTEAFPLPQNSAYCGSSEKLLEPPAPPQRKSSYEVTSQISSLSGSGRYIHSSVRNGDGNNTLHHPKKVSFHDSQIDTEISYDANGNHDLKHQTLASNSTSQSYTLQDIDEVLATPHNSQNLNTYNPGNTPGVIGAQEVYRDPRQRIEAERTQQEHYSSRGLGPEKLSFKEKMKMFAKETGEPETPKDKVKISRAQRDIETNLNGT